MKKYKIQVTKNSKEWYNLEGQLHREDGPAVEYKNGDKSYYMNGKRHREDGPAMEYVDGYKSYYINGNRHREDGPSVEYAGGDKSYYINGIYLTEQEFNDRNKSCEGRVGKIDGVKYKLSKI